MPRPTVRPLETADIPACGQLLAERHARDAARVPALDLRLLDPGFATGRLAEGLPNPRLDSAVAVQDGAIVGFLFGERMLLPPDYYASLYIEHHSAVIPVTGHAVSVMADAATVYRDLYTYLAERWVGAGFFAHTVHVVPGDVDVQEAWVSLGFGRKITAAVRPTGPVALRQGSSVEIHQASLEDIDVVQKLEHTLALHHASSPMFWPYLRDTDASFRHHQAELLEDPKSAYFVAYDGESALGMQTFVVPGFTPPIVKQDGTVYLYEGVVDPGARGGGVGHALLSEGMAWAREAGYENCCLHFASDNPSGAPFWLGQGFVPVEHAMVRRIDERITWAGPR